MKFPHAGIVIAMTVITALAVASEASGQQSASAGQHHDHEGMSVHADEHAVHQAAMSQARYSVSSESYDVPELELIDAEGITWPLASLLASDEPVALNFIFTTCTTICPVMTATFAQMQRHLGSASDHLQLVSITIDPEYDRPKILKAYAAQFHAENNWVFLTGDSPDIVNVLRAFDVYTGSKMNHQPVTLLKSPQEKSWTRIEGLASGEGLAREITARLLN